MATVTGLTAARMKEIEDASVVDGEVRSGNLILTKHDGNEINAGSVIGPVGPQGPQGLSAIPGEVKLWPSDTLPDLADWGRWVWADGGIYVIAEHPIAAAHISDLWNTFGNPPLDPPGAGNFRVPDLRGLVAAGMDGMPGGLRKMRMTRDEAIVLAKTTGEERHRLAIGEVPKHHHPGSTISGGVGGSLDGAVNHQHTIGIMNTGPGYGMQKDSSYYAQSVLLKSGGSNNFTTTPQGAHSHGLTNLTVNGTANVADEGSDNPVHENVQPTVFVPYIVCLDE